MQEFHSTNFIEVDKPIDNRCGCGHFASPLFRRDGNSEIAYPTRFFRIQNQNIDLIVCEPCLVLANHLARLKKKAKV